MDSYRWVDTHTIEMIKFEEGNGEMNKGKHRGANEFMNCRVLEKSYILL